MEILKRARGPNDGDVVSFGPAPAGLQDELNLRSFKAGHTDRDGQPKDLPKIRSMPSNEQYRKNYRRIFGHD